MSQRLAVELGPSGVRVACLRAHLIADGASNGNAVRSSAGTGWRARLGAGARAAHRVVLRASHPNLGSGPGQWPTTRSRKEEEGGLAATDLPAPGRSLAVQSAATERPPFTRRTVLQSEACLCQGRARRRGEAARRCGRRVVVGSGSGLSEEPASSVLEDLSQPLDLPGPGIDLGLAVAGQLTHSRISGGGT
jgi:hypothetical protein